MYNNRKHPTLLITLETTAPEVYNRLRRVAEFWNPMATDDDITSLLSRLRIVDQRMGEGDLVRLVEEFEEEAGARPDLVMVDYPGYYANRIRGGSPYERVSKAAIGLKEELKEARVAGIIPHQAGRGAAGGTPVSITDARDSAVIEDTADIALPIQFRGGPTYQGGASCHSLDEAVDALRPSSAISPGSIATDRCVF